MKALLESILVAAFGLLASLASHPNPLPRTFWEAPVTETFFMVPAELRHDAPWWLEELKLRPHLVRAAQRFAVAAVAAKSFQRAIWLAGTAPFSSSDAGCEAGTP